MSTAPDPFLATSADTNLANEPAPAIHSGCTVTPIIDAADYNSQVLAAINAVGKPLGPNDPRPDEKILIANWLLSLQGGEGGIAWRLASTHGPNPESLEPYLLDGPNGHISLSKLLVEKARAGVDVRTLGWISWSLMRTDSTMKYVDESLAECNAQTMVATRDLRNEPTIGPKAVLNTSCHPAGAVHAKVVLVIGVSSAVAFVGGIDFASNRWAHADHPDFENWHDVAVRIEGSAVQEVYDLFKLMWTDNLKRAPINFTLAGKTIMSYVEDANNPTPPLMDLTVPALDPPGVQTVQVARTIPQFNIAWYNLRPTLPMKPIDGAKDGAFEVKVCWRKAISKARQYVYMEDQGFWSTEVMGWLNQALHLNSNLKVILLASGGADPADGQMPVEQMLTRSINGSLLKGFDPADIPNRVQMYKKLGETVQSRNFTIISTSVVGLNVRVQTNLKQPALPANCFGLEGQLVIGADTFQILGNDAISPPGGPLVLTTTHSATGGVPTGTGFVRWRDSVTVHAKTTIIDDHWAIIGSANCMRRSLYTDIECSAAFVDGPATTTVRDYRRNLWATHFHHSPATDFNDLASALYAWSPNWGPAGNAIPMPPQLSPVSLPLNTVAFTDEERRLVDIAFDPDSREPWTWYRALLDRIVDKVWN